MSDTKQTFEGLILNKYRNDRGVRLLKGLFWEVALDHSKCLYTLRRDDREVTLDDGTQVTIPSIRRLYLDCMDPTEYDFANKYFEDFEHWELVANSPFLAEHVASWRKELKIRIKSEAYKQIAQEAFMGGRNSFQANKYLYEGSTPAKATKAERQAQDEIESLASDDKQLTADLVRLGIKVE